MKLTAMNILLMVDIGIGREEMPLNLTEMQLLEFSLIMILIGSQEVRLYKLRLLDISI